MSVFAFLIFGAGVAKAAGAGTVAISGSQSTYSVGDTFSVSIDANISSGILGAIEANLKFDPAILQYISLQESTDFDETFEKSTPPETAGAIHLVRGKLGGATGSMKVYSVTFKALQAGSVTITSPLTTLVDADGTNMAVTISSFPVTIANNITITPATTPTVALTVNNQAAASITAGQSIKLKWSTTDAASCISSWAGDKTASGEDTVTPLKSGSFSYSLVCIGEGTSPQSASAQVNVTVTSPTTTLETPVVTEYPSSEETPTTSTATTTTTKTAAAAPMTTTVKTQTPVTSVKTATIFSLIDIAKSTVSFDKLAAVSNGQDKICMSITMKDKNGKVVTATKPTVQVIGGVDLTELALSGDSWSLCMSSTSASDKKVTTSIYGVIFSDQALSFTLPPVVEQILKTKEPEATALTQSAVLDLELDKVLGDIILPAEANKTAGENDLVQFEGTGDPNTIIKVLIHSPEQIEREVTVDSSGKWSLKLDQKLSVGQHRVQVVVLDRYGNQSSAKTLTTFSIVKSQSLLLPYIGAGAILLILIVAAIFLVRGINKKKKKVVITEIPSVKPTQTPNPLSTPIAPTQPPASRQPVPAQTSVPSPAPTTLSETAVIPEPAPVPQQPPLPESVATPAPAPVPAPPPASVPAAPVQNPSATPTSNPEQTPAPKPEDDRPA